MSRLTALLAGGIDYFQESEPTGNSEEIWLPITDKTFDATVATGATKNTTVSHNLHTGGVNDVDSTENVVYSSDSDGLIYAVDTTDGSQIWSSDLHNSASVSAVDVSNGVAYSGGTGFNAIAYDIESDSELWSTNIGGPVTGLESGSGAVYVAGSQSVVALDASDGSQLWSHTLHDDITDVAVSNGVVVSSSQKSTVIAVDASDGSQLWSHDHHVIDTSFDYPLFGVSISDGTVFSAGNNEAVVAADLSDGSFLWSHSHHTGNPEGLSVENGVVYSSGDKIVAADISDGSKVWEDTGISGFIPEVSVSRDRLYCASNSGEMVAVDIDDFPTQFISAETGTLRVNYNGTWLDKA